MSEPLKSSIAIVHTAEILSSLITEMVFEDRMKYGKAILNDEQAGIVSRESSIVSNSRKLGKSLTTHHSRFMILL